MFHWDPSLVYGKPEGKIMVAINYLVAVPIILLIELFTTLILPFTVMYAVLQIVLISTAWEDTKKREANA